MQLTRVVLTGGPGAGKTSVLVRLQELGYAVVPDMARQFIADRKSKGLSPRPPPVDFARAILEEDMGRYDSVSDGIVFFDRGILDALAMLNECGALCDKEREDILARYPYSSPVFVFPPWREIYRTDTERDQNFKESVQVHSFIRDWYLKIGYDVSTVPIGAIHERCEYILKTLGEYE